MNIKDKILAVLNLIIPFFILCEIVLSKSIVFKLAILIVVVLFLILLFRKKITISEQKKFDLLLSYIMKVNYE